MLGISSLMMAKSVDTVVRHQFRLHCIYILERRKTRDLLLNLLPKDIADRMLSVSSRLPSDVRCVRALHVCVCVCEREIADRMLRSSFRFPSDVRCGRACVCERTK